MAQFILIDIILNSNWDSMRNLNGEYDIGYVFYNLITSFICS